MTHSLPHAYPLTRRDPAGILFRGPGGPVTAAMFLAAAHHLAAALPPATHVVNLCQDRFHFTVALAAAVLRGQVSLLTSDRSDARLRRFAALFPGAVSVSEDPAVASPLPHHRFAATPRGPADNPAIPTDRLAAIVFTSGSTGEPVGNRKTWGALVERSLMAARRFALADGPHADIVGTVPPQHMYGFETTVLLPLHVPVASWHGPAFYPGDIQSALRAAVAPRVLVTTPLQLRTLLAAGVALPPLAQVISATAPLSTETAAAAEARWNVPVREIFGATEVGSVASRRTVDGDAWQIYPGVRFARSAAGVTVHAAFAEPCPLNDEVELLDGETFRLLGRKADMIKLAGKRASLAGLNQILNGIDGVADGLFVAPDDLDLRPNARLLAFVVAPDRSAEDILAALRGRIDPIFLPRRVVLVDDLPRNEVGKLSRQAVIAMQARAGDN
jgi:acyl-coenzyme A synthetase/AMP-(fatty) acid ligase